MTAAARDSRHDVTALLVLLVPIYAELGCTEEALRLIEQRWERLNARGEGVLEPAVKLLRQHIELTLRPAPIEARLASLIRAALLAPEDDRVWLGRANLALRAAQPMSPPACSISVRRAGL